MKHKTAKQKVLELYPNAKYYREAGRVAVYAYHNRDIAIFSKLYIQPVNAWKDAWKLIQKEMMKKLESSNPTENS